MKQGDRLAANHPLVRRHPERFADGDTAEQLAAARASFSKSSATNDEDESLQPAEPAQPAADEDQGDGEI